MATNIRIRITSDQGELLAAVDDYREVIKTWHQELKHGGVVYLVSATGTNIAINASKIISIEEA